MIWLYYTLLTSLFWGIGQILIKKGLTNISPLINNIISTIVCLLIFLPFAFINGINLNLINPLIVIFILLIAFSYQIYYYALSKGEVSSTGTVMAAYPLVTVLLSRIFLGEKTNLFQKLAIFMVILGTVIISLPNKNNKKTSSKIWFWWALANVIIIGFGDFLAKVTINDIGPYNYLFLLPIFYIPVNLVLFLIDKKGRQTPRFNFQQFLPTFIGVLMIEIGIIFFNLGFAHGQASLVTPLSSSYAAIAVVLALIFLKEKVTKIQLSGIILTIIGIILFGVS